MPDPADFRAQFPVLQTKTYLNAGTEGPAPLQVTDAVAERVRLEVEGSRSGKAYVMAGREVAAALRAGYARLLGCDPADLALTDSTTDGCNTILLGLDLRAGDEIVTSDEEHPGLLAPLGRLKRKGVKVTVAPFAEIADAISPSTRLVACSHVSWVSGRVVDTEALKATSVPFLLDGAQSIGAIPADVEQLGCTYYAGSGQKWLCGPQGSGVLYVRRDHLDELSPPWPSYFTITDVLDALDSPPSADAQRLDQNSPPGVRTVWALASLTVLESAGWEWVHGRAASLASGFADALTEQGREVAPRDTSTLVSWAAADADAEVLKLAEAGVVVRSIPSHGLVRASVGAWCSEDELQRAAELAGRN
jgi:selenocysteine lyase/cysteine desulfurase